MSLRIVFIALFVLILNACSPSDQYFRDRTVMLKGKHGACSGEQIVAPSGENYILTAAHCRDIAVDGSMTVIMESGASLQRKVIAEDPNSDLLLLEGLPGTEGLRIAKSYRMTQEIRTFTHGARMDTYKTEGVLVQKTKVEIPMYDIQTPEQEEACSSAPKTKPIDGLFGRFCLFSSDEVVTTAMIVPGSSGGMVVDSSGRLVGVVSAGGGGFGYLVPLEAIHAFLEAY
jgi:hypothetical protein